jgi:hypothetical protein
MVTASVKRNAWLYVLLYTIVDFKSSLELVLYVWFISTLNKALNWIELVSSNSSFNTCGHHFVLSKARVGNSSLTVVCLQNWLPIESTNGNHWCCLPPLSRRRILVKLKMKIYLPGYYLRSLRNQPLVEIDAEEVNTTIQV